MATSEQLSLNMAVDGVGAGIIPDGLPDGWQTVRLDAVCDVNPSRKGHTNYADDLPVTFVPMAAVNETSGTIVAPEIKPFGAVKKGYTWFLENDVLFAKITPCMQNGKAAIARNLSNGVGFGSTEFHVLRPGPDVLPAWVHLFIRQPSFRRAAARHFTGTVGQQRVPESFLATHTLPLPPLAEQRRIVARVEELAARIEQARGLRRQATEEVSVAVERAKALVLDQLEYPELPLGSLLRGNSQNGLSARPSDVPPGVQILRISAGTARRDAIVDESEYKYLQVGEGDTAKYRVQPGDLLACRFNGNLHFVGRFSFYQGYSGESQIYPDKLIRFRIDESKAQPKFVNYVMNSPKRRTIVESFCATTAGNIGISAGNLKMIRIPVPPVAEQKRIVFFLDAVQKRAKMLRQRQDSLAAELGILFPTILERAFRGEL